MYLLFVLFFTEISRASIKITYALRRIFVFPIQLETVCRIFAPVDGVAFMLHV